METIIATVGSDASYDLIMEAIPKIGRAECVLMTANDAFLPRSRYIMKQIEEKIRQEDEFSLRIHLFQRFPDEWVWMARLDALIEKFERNIRAGR